MVDENTKIPFGVHKGIRMKFAPTSFLEWMVKHLKDGDLYEFAATAGQILKDRKSDSSKYQDLEQAADEFLRSKGIDPKKL